MTSSRARDATPAASSLTNASRAPRTVIPERRATNAMDGQQAPASSAKDHNARATASCPPLSGESIRRRAASCFTRQPDDATGLGNKGARTGVNPSAAAIRRWTTNTNRREAQPARRGQAPPQPLPDPPGLVRTIATPGLSTGPRDAEPNPNGRPASSLTEGSPPPVHRARSGLPRIGDPQRQRPKTTACQNARICPSTYRG